MHQHIAHRAAAVPPPLADAPPVAARARPAKPGDRATGALLAALVALPVLLMVLGAWAAWRNAWTAAEAEVAQA
uniref:hypothetical protein n=1 Tax=Falsiroseomonas oryzae TaxID=2766473 RepID=UPI0022EA221E